jgi:DNA-binding MarR family transcriptional regulator
MNIIQFPSPLELAMHFVEAHGYTVLPPPPPEIDLTPGEREVLGHLSDTPQLPRVIAARCHYAHNSVRRFLTILSHKGYVVRVGSRNSGGWVLVERLQMAA